MKKLEKTNTTDILREKLGGIKALTPKTDIDRLGQAIGEVTISQAIITNEIIDKVNEIIEAIGVSSTDSTKRRP